ncbi:hypothetical protein BC830DRAFT_1170598 [Chytriomyces sp. MP71]|nr:hypothetical protein BC830DRAFT_1170598 [Chytriomyces sp. MP71]
MHAAKWQSGNALPAEDASPSWQFAHSYQPTLRKLEVTMGFPITSPGSLQSTVMNAPFVVLGDSASVSLPALASDVGFLLGAFLHSPRKQPTLKRFKRDAFDRFSAVQLALLSEAASTSPRNHILFDHIAAAWLEWLDADSLTIHVAVLYALYLFYKDQCERDLDAGRPLPRIRITPARFNTLVSTTLPECATQSLQDPITLFHFLHKKQNAFHLVAIDLPLLPRPSLTHSIAILQSLHTDPILSDQNLTGATLGAPTSPGNSLLATLYPTPAPSLQSQLATYEEALACAHALDAPANVTQMREAMACLEVMKARYAGTREEVVRDLERLGGLSSTPDAVLNGETSTSGAAGATDVRNEVEHELVRMYRLRMRAAGLPF